MSVRVCFWHMVLGVFRVREVVGGGLGIVWFARFGVGAVVSSRMSALEIASAHKLLGRKEVFISDDESRCVLVLEFVFRSDDITVWHGGRTLAVMGRSEFVDWLWRGGVYVMDDLAWNVEGHATLLTIDGHHTYMVDGTTVAELAEFA